MSASGVGEVVLAVENLRVELGRGASRHAAVTGVDLEVRAGECVGLVGESGSGKSLTLKAIAGLLPPIATASGQRHLAMPGGRGPRPYEPDDIRGSGIAMVFQEPMSALNPTMRVGDLIAEGARARGDLSKREARRIAVDLMREVGIPDPERRARSWPHELSGGLRQRVMIALALAADPVVLLCDEPTTALDVTIQDQILGLLQRERERRGLAVVFVTHDLGVIGQIADRVAVMYAGELVETGPIDALFRSPDHPYTLGLLRSIPSVTRRSTDLASIPGQPPDLHELPAGCRFAERCSIAQESCTDGPIPLDVSGDERQSRCLYHADLAEAQGVAGR